MSACHFQTNSTNFIRLKSQKLNVRKGEREGERRERERERARKRYI